MSYRITETTTYEIFADTQEKAREIWNRYWRDDEDASTLDMVSIEAEWQWTETKGQR